MSAPSPPNIYIRPKCLLNSVVLYWRAPVSSGGSEVNTYTVTCDSPSYSETVSGSTYQLTIPSLSQGTDYTFQITATNNSGTSEAATYRTVQVGLKPGGVRNPTISSSASTSAYVTWDFSTNTGEAPTNWFVLTAIPSTSGVAIIKQSAHGYARSRFVVDLAPLNNYQILVQAVNDVGYAPPTQITSSINTGVSGSAPPPEPLTYWLPTVVTGLQAWYDGSDPLGTGTPSTPGAALPTWYDKSGNSRDAVATGSPLFTTYSQNNLAGISYVGNSGPTIYYTAPIPAGTFSEATTFFVVYKSTRNNTNNALVTRGYDGFNGGTPDIYSTGIFVEKPGTATSYAYTGANVYNTSASLFQVTVDQYGNSVSERRNGTTVSVTGSEAETLSAGMADALNTSLFIGTRGDLVTSFGGIFYEILAYNKVLTQSERQTIEGYLAWKWGLQELLPEGHAFISAAPATNQTVLERKTALLLKGTYYSGSGAWLDQTTEENDATLETGSISYISPNAISFNGSTSWTVPNLVLGSAWTLNVWFKDNETSGTKPAIITQIGNPNAGIVYNGSQWLAVTNDDLETGTPFTLTAGQWTNIQVTNDGANMITYINGVSIGAVAVTGASSDNETDYSIGGSASGTDGYVTGAIGEIRAYNYAAPLAQVQADYSASLQNYGFNPAAIASLQAWYDATDPLGTGAPVANAAAVGTWADKSSNEASATATGTPTLAKVSQNRLPGISLPLSTQSYFTVPIAVKRFNNAATFFVVYKSNHSGVNIAAKSLIARGSTTSTVGNPDVYNTSVSLPIYDANDSIAPTIKTYTGASVYTPAPTIFNIAVDQEGNAVVERLNGNVVAVTVDITVPLNPNTADPVQNRLFIGTSADSAAQFCGAYNEILVYNTALSESRRQVIEGYLAWKWGLQSALPANHPYLTSPLPPTTITTIPRKTLLLLKATNYSGTGAWSDESGNGNNATLSSGTIAKNADGNGIVLDGQTAWTFPNIALTNEWTVNVWYKNKQDTNAALIGQINSDGNNRNMVVILSDNSAVGGFSNGVGYHLGGTATVDAHAWSNVQVTWNGLNITTYLNGAILNTLYIGASTTFNDQAYYIGRNFTDDYVIGEIGEVRIYNYAIGPQKVQQDYQDSYSTFNLSDPLTVTGCQLWLDGADLSTITATGATVTQWNDKSTNDNHTSGVVGTPLKNANGSISGVIFDGSSYFSLPNGTIPHGDTSYTVYIMAQVNTATTATTLLAAGDDGEGATYNAFGTSATSNLVVKWLDLSSNNVFIGGRPFLMTTKYQSGAAASLFVSGDLDTTVTPSARTQTNTLNFLGAQAAGAEPLTGIIYEVLVYNTAHTMQQQELIEGYLTYKWSIQAQLPVNHLYYNHPPSAEEEGFSPNKLATLRLWLDGKRINNTATTNSPVPSWVDWSYNGYDASMAAVANQPTVAGAAGGVYFSDEDSNYMTFPELVPLGTSLSCFFVTSGTSANQVYLYTTDNNLSEVLFNYNATTPSLAQFNVGASGAGDSNFITPGTALPQINLYNFTTIDGTSNIGHYMGTQVFSVTPFTASGTSQISGIASGGTNNFDGTIYEMVFFNRALSDSERQKMEGYLAWKWGIQESLPEAHPYYDAAPA